jgi:hypothetical protein
MKEGDHFVQVRVDGMAILKWILNERSLTMLTELFCVIISS